MYDLGFFLSLFSHKKRVIIDESCFDLISFFFLVLIWIITASFLIVIFLCID